MTATNIDELLVDLFFLDNSKVEALDIEIKRLEDKLDVIVGTDDPNGVIDKWNEIIQFLNGIDEDETLLSILLDQKQKLRSESSELFSNSISNCMNLIKASYDILVTDTAMLASDKANLTKAYTAYQLKAETLVTAITGATDTEKTTDSELDSLKTAASDYSSAVLIYKTIEEQVRQIQRNNISLLTSYSTEEKWTGTYWIDGSKIYQKTISIGKLPNNTTIEIKTDINNLKLVVDFKGCASNLGGTTQIPLPFISNTSGASVELFVFNEFLHIKTALDRSTYVTAYVTLQYVCYNR